MALLFCDSFDAYGNSPITVRWDCLRPGLVAIQGLHARTGLALNFQTPDVGVARQTFDSHTLIVGFAAFRFAVAGIAVLAFWDGVFHATQLTIALRSTGQLEVHRGNYLGPTIGVTTVAWPRETWVYIEIRVTFDGVSGAVEIRFDGATVLSLSGVNTDVTGSTTASTLCLNCDNPVTMDRGLFGSWFVDDLYLLTGDSPPNDDFLGPVFVHAIFPNGEGDFSGWRPVGASPNWRCVDGDDTDPYAAYIAAYQVGQEDTYPFPQPTSLNILAIQVGILWRSSPPSPITAIQSVTRIGGVDYYGLPGEALTSKFDLTPWDYRPDIFDIWPSNFTDFTQFGVNLVFSP
jgi:hypothetical protein